MTALRRTAKVRGYSMGPLDLPSHCDICGKPKSFGLNTYKHEKCSKVRQARYAVERAKG